MIVFMRCVKSVAFQGESFEQDVNTRLWDWICHYVLCLLLFELKATEQQNAAKSERGEVTNTILEIVFCGSL